MARGHRGPAGPPVLCIRGARRPTPRGRRRAVALRRAGPPPTPTPARGGPLPPGATTGPAFSFSREARGSSRLSGALSFGRAAPYPQQLFLQFPAVEGDQRIEVALP